MRNAISLEKPAITLGRIVSSKVELTACKDFSETDFPYLS